MWDLFLSYHGVDRPRARELARWLGEQGLHVFFDERAILPGDAWLRALEQGIGTASAFAVLLTDRAPQRWVEAETRVALIRAVSDPSFRIVPLLVGDFAPAAMGGFLATYQGFRLPGSSSAWRDAVPELVRLLRAPDRALGARVAGAEPLTPLSPFPGLLPFDERQAQFFFGRSREVAEAISGLGSTRDRGHRRWLQIEGASGSGKSSLARAGVIAAVQHQGLSGAPERWRVVVCRPGLHPVDSLAVQLASAYGLDREDVADKLNNGAPGAMRRLLETLPGGEALLVVVDQLEEVWALGSSDEASRFTRCLHEAITGDAATYLVTTIRSEFVGRLGDSEGLARALNTHASRYFLRPLDREGLRQAVAGMTAVTALSVEPGLIERVISDAGAHEGSLPLVGHALAELWQRRSRSAELTHAAYDAIGGVSGALAIDADRLFDSFSPEQREGVRRMLLRLVEIGRGVPDTRRPAGRALTLIASGLPPASAEEALLRISGGRDPLAPSESVPSVRLVVVSRPESEGFDRVDLAHEALLSAWPRFRQWLDAERRALERRDDLEAAVVVWERAGRPAQDLPSGALLAWYRGDDFGPEMAELYRSLLDAASREWLDLATVAEQEERERTERERQAQLDAAQEQARERTAAAARLRRWVRGFAIVAGVAALAAGGFGWAFREARRHRALADSRLQRALDVAHLIHFKVDRSLQPIAGASGVRRELLKAADDLLEPLGSAYRDATERERIVSNNVQGDLAKSSGDLWAARLRYEASLSVHKMRASSDPTNPDWQRDLLASHDGLGDLAMATGDLSSARSHYDASLSIREKLASSDPMNLGWQRDLLVSHERVGDLAMATGDLSSARSHYDASLSIREKLASSELTNSDWQRDLSVRYERLGDLTKATGDLSSARSHYDASLSIREKLASSDPNNHEWKLDVVISHLKLSEWADSAGKSDQRATHHAAARARLAELESSKAGADDPRVAQLRAALTRMESQR